MKKTKYFAEHSIASTSKTMFGQLGNQFDLHQDKLLPPKAALLILDMQEFFHNKNSHAFVPSADAIIVPINSVVQKFSEYNRPIIITRHLNTNDNAKQMNYWWRDTITENGGFSQLISEFDIPQTNLIVKSQYDAFYNTNLDDILQKNNVEQVLITGVMTHLCCETTARSAFVHGYNVFFPIDGTATYNEQFHLATLTNLAHGFANITLIDKLIKEF